MPVSILPDASTHEPRVTVLVPTYNRAPMLRECLESLMRQTLAPLEVIVVDDGSTDGTESIAKAFPSVRYVRKENQGKARALNHALPMVRGDWLWFFDDDDVALPRSIELRWRAVQSDPSVDLVVSRFVWGTSDAGGRAVPREQLRWPALTPETFYPSLVRSCCAHLNGALVRMLRVRGVGPFRTDLLASEDYEFTLRLARGARVALCDEPTFIFRQHPGQRGPDAQRYESTERLWKFAQGDAEVGRWIRSTHGLHEYLGRPASHSLTARETREASCARLLAMANKGLFKEVGQDLLALASALSDAGQTLDDGSRKVVASAMQEDYLTMQLARAEDLGFAAFALLGQSRIGRLMLRAAAASLLRKNVRSTAPQSERRALIRLSARLAWLGWGASRWSPMRRGTANG